MKQLLEYSKQLDAQVEEAEKVAYKVGFDAAKGIPFQGYETKYKVTEKNKDAKLEQMEK